MKLKVGANLDDDRRRCAIAREVIGPDRNLMIDANQVWDVGTAIDWVRELADFNPLWIEEPTSPDDVLGHATIRRAVSPIGVATGEHGMNRVLFKQLFQAEAIDFCQIDSCRLGSVNEILPVMLMAAKYGIPVCPHAGGVGLCELVQHLSMIDFLIISGSTEGRVAEYVDHLHEHFVDPCVVEDAAYVVPRRPATAPRCTRRRWRRTRSRTARTGSRATPRPTKGRCADEAGPRGTPRPGTAGADHRRRRPTT